MADGFITFQDFSGGENTLKPPNMIDDNQCSKITNMIPSTSNNTLELRGGTKTHLAYSPDPTERIWGMFTYRRSDKGTDYFTYQVYSTNNHVYASRINGLGNPDLGITWTNNSGIVRFTVLLDKLFITRDQYNPIYVWDGSTPDIPAKEVVQIDNPLQPGTTKPGPRFPYMINYKGRIWLGGVSSTVMYCGTDDTRVGAPRYTSWAGSLPSDGGSLVIAPDDGTMVTGLATMQEGIVVFKERSCYLWSYSDDAIPKVEGTVQPLIQGVGCVSHDTIQYYNGSILFLGRSNDGLYGVYSLSGQSSGLISKLVPKAMDRLRSNSLVKPTATLFDGVYYISSGTNTYAYDLKRRLWYEISGWNTLLLSIRHDNERMLISSNEEAVVYTFPDGHADSFGHFLDDPPPGEVSASEYFKPINWEVELKAIATKNALMRKRWRNLIADVASSGYRGTIGFVKLEDGRLHTIKKIQTNRTGNVQWGAEANGGTGNKWGDGSTYGSSGIITRYVSPIETESNQLQVVLRGSGKGVFGVTRIGLRYRDRKVPTV